MGNKCKFEVQSIIYMTYILVSTARVTQQVSGSNSYTDVEYFWKYKKNIPSKDRKNFSNNLI